MEFSQGYSGERTDGEARGPYVSVMSCQDKQFHVRRLKYEMLFYHLLLYSYFEDIYWTIFVDNDSTLFLIVH